MDLRLFVKEAIVEIMGGVSDAQDEVEFGQVIPDAPAKTTIAPSPYKTIDFEVAVTTESRDGSEDKVTVMAVILKGQGGDHKERAASNVSKLKFSIPVRFATDPKEIRHKSRRSFDT